MQRRSRAHKGASLTNRASSSSMPEPRADNEEDDCKTLDEALLDEPESETVSEAAPQTPKDSVAMPDSQCVKWPAYRCHFYSNWRKTKERVYAKCNLCLDNKYHIGIKSSFSNFIRHLQRFHKEEWDSFESSKESKQPSIRSLVSPRVPSRGRKVQLDRLLCQMVITDNLPLNIVRRQGFRSLISALYPDYKIPSPEKLRKLIDELFEETKAALRDKLERVNSTSIIMDLWSSKTMRGYLGISCTGVTEDYEPFNASLSLRPMQGRHTGAAIFAEYESVVKEWNITNKVIRVMTDNASNMKSAFSTSLPSWEAAPSRGGMPMTDDTDECDDDDDDDDDVDGWVDLELEIDEETELWGVVPVDGEDQEYIQLKFDLEEIFDEYLTTSENRPSLVSRFRFRNGCTIKDNLLRLETAINIGFENKKTTSAIFLDLAKAYDSTWITGLLYKITKLKIHGPILRWIKNFITERNIAVRMDNNISTDRRLEENSVENSHKRLLFPIVDNSPLNGPSKSSGPSYSVKKRVSTYSWNEETIQLLIQSVSQYPVLFDITFADYKDVTVHVRANDSIAKGLPKNCSYTFTFPLLY
ncbi:Uncharacterized protein APZ42_013065 [Daphnia magna]|uniref:Uncharacterized protein n=1 Tax=Daphnia magna TaxID=35525 RepID=A0A162R737_9CRUS|nr:Uncharacterized protein APZ42_013065 [Daphnia magna]